MFFVLFFINIKTRKVHIAGLTPYPDHEWVNKQTQLLLPPLNDGKKVKNVQKEKGVILHEVENPSSFALR